mmetsp:Transcript_26667/g.63580  ORF Transcript_26667/g.63580 Transcript_26667/m.63580 type:complete len:709 (+) Transcript_26667:412-2538(+)
MTRSIFHQGHRDDSNKSGDSTSNNNNGCCVGGGGVVVGRDEKRQHQDEVMEEITLSYLDRMEEDSQFFSNDFPMDVSSRLIPQFDPTEIKLGTMVGMGEYGTVTKVVGVHLLQQHESSSDDAAVDTNVKYDDNKKEVLNAEKHSTNNAGNETTIAQQQEQQQQQQQQRRKLFPSSNCLPALPPRATSMVEPAPKSWSVDESLIAQGMDNTNQGLSQSITIAQLSVEPKVPTTLGLTRIRRRSGVLSPDVLAMSGPGSDAEQSLRIQISEETNSIVRHHQEYGVVRRSSNGDNKNSIAPTVVIGSSLFALKQVRKDLYPKKRCEAAKDLAREAKFLARLSHPNIVCLRGLVSQPGRPAFGILLDRLRITLSEEAVLWKSRQPDVALKSRSVLVSPLEMFATNLTAKWPFWQPHHKNDNNHSSNNNNKDGSSGDHNKTSEIQQAGSPTPSQAHFQSQQYSKDATWLMGERLLALHDVAQALEYLHDRKIIFRDLKTENCAMLGRSRFQLFDFGLAKECKTIDRCNQEIEGTELESTNDTIDGNSQSMGFYDSFKMTGLTGTLRIMSPETIQCLPYGLPADVYSFSICMWEVFMGERCSSLTAGDVVRGERPPVPPFDSACGVGLPPDLADFLKQCWDADPMKRPNFVTICGELKSQLLNLRQSGTAASGVNDNAAIGGHGSLFWDRLESLQHPIVFDQNGTETAATLVVH